MAWQDFWYVKASLQRRGARVGIGRIAPAGVTSLLARDRPALLTAAVPAAVRTR